jgi:hypothetical protein
MPFLCIRRTELTENRASKAPMVICRRLGSVSRRRSIRANFWKGIIIAADNYFHKGLGSSPLNNIATNLLSRAAMDDRLAMSLDNSHVHPSRWGGDFFYMPVTAFITAFTGFGMKADSRAKGGGGI